MNTILVLGLICLASGLASPALAQATFRHIWNPNSGRCMDISGGSMDDEAQAVIFDCIKEKGNQLFEMKKLDDGGYHIVAKHSRKCLTVNGGTLNNGALVQQSICMAGVDSQIWTLENADEENRKVLFKLLADTNMCLDVSGGSKDNSAKLQMWQCNQGENQKFQFDPFLRVETKFTHIQNPYSGRCLDVASGKNANNGNIIIWSCTNPIFGKNQNFKLLNAGNGYSLIAEHSGKCLTVKGGRMESGTSIVQYTCVSGSENQIFTIEDVPDSKTGEIFIHPLNYDNLVLDVKGLQKEGGTDIILFSKNGGDNQKFTFEPELTWI